MLKKINFSKKGIIFDFDDTLINSKPGKDKALKIISGQIYSYFKKKKAKVNLNKLYQEIKTLAIQMDARGIYNRNLWWSRVIKKFLKEKPSKSFLDEVTKNYWEMVIKKSSLYKDTSSTLVYLKKKKYTLGLLTDADGIKEFKLKRIRASNLKKWFDSIIIAGDDIKQIKPDKAPFSLIARKLNLKPQKCIFVGDDLYRDILGAKRSGMTAILIKRRNGKMKVKPDRIIKKLSELKEIL